ncbi:hypothetical protein [Kitasatospora cinereorecta]|uniref:Uncharacterized protein n=1 Tax=Kitasatospora cinereorecta TaxID=285560 RepID=A0ABW0VEI3_9ACTN
MTKKNRPTPARAARTAQHAGTTTPYTALLRAARTRAADEPTIEALTALLIGNTMAVGPDPAGWRAWASAAAEALTSLTRRDGGEAYPAAAQVELLPAGEPQEPPFAVLTVVARRAWTRAGEWQAVLQDVRDALDPAADPVPLGRFAAVLPIGSAAADVRRGRRAERVVFAARSAAADVELQAALAAGPRTWPVPYWPESQDRQAPYRPDAAYFRAGGQDPEQWAGTLCLRCGCTVARACPHCPGCYCSNDTCPDPDLRHRQQHLTDVGGYLLTVRVPAGTDERHLAQRAADTVRSVTRRTTGETYPAAAAVLRLDEPWRTVSGPAGDLVEARLLVCCETVRDWDTDGELDRTRADLAYALERFGGAAQPAPWGKLPVARLLQPAEADQLRARAVWAAATRDADPLVRRADGGSR